MTVVDIHDEDAMMQEVGKDLQIEGFIPPVVNTEPGAGGGMPNASGDTAAAATAADANTQNADANTNQPDPAAAAAAAAASAPVVTPPIETVNYEGISNGLIKNVDDITRISTEYQQLKQETEQLKAKAAVDPFANPFLKDLNQMYADGKSAEQIKTFVQLQELGDISKLSPIEAMIQTRALRDGRDPDMTRKQIERKYGITEDMDPEVKKIIELDIADDAKPDYEYLQTQKKELALPAVKVPDPNINALTDEAIRSQVAPIKEKIKEQFTSLGTINLNGKVDAEGKPAKDAIMLELPVPKEFHDKLPALVENFFVSSNLPVTQDNMKTCLEVINYELFNNYGVKMIQDSVNHALKEQAKTIRAEYENQGGLQHPTGTKKINDLALTDEFYAKIASGE